MKNLPSEASRQVEASSIRRMFNIAAGMKDVVNLGIGEPDFDTPPNIIAAAKAAMDENRTHYTANAGEPVLRQAAAQKLQRENGISADPDEDIIITTGAMGGLYLALQSIIDPGDEVILPVPIWPNYANQVRMAGGIPVYVYTLPSEGFAVDPEELRKCITPRTRAILLNTPANPTGAVYSRQALEALSALAIERDLLVLSDEVYEYFIWDAAEHVSIGALPGMKERTITINSLSKAYSMTGWRVGYAAAPPEVTAAMIKLQENVYACVNSIAQAAAVEALQGTREYVHEMIAEYRKRRTFMLENLDKIPGLEIVKPDGAFYLITDIGALECGSDDFALRLLKETGVCLVPGTAFGDCGREYVRISYANNLGELEKAVRRIDGFVNAL